MSYNNLCNSVSLRQGTVTSWKRRRLRYPPVIFLTCLNNVVTLAISVTHFSANVLMLIVHVQSQRSIIFQRHCDSIRNNQIQNIDSLSPFTAHTQVDCQAPFLTGSDISNDVLTVLVQRSDHTASAAVLDRSVIIGNLCLNVCAYNLCAYNCQVSNYTLRHGFLTTAVYTTMGADRGQRGLNK